METPKPLATESFSYSWLAADIKPHSPRNPTDRDHTFDFNVPSCASFLHADELFADGRIVAPVRVENLSFSVPQSPSPVYPYFAAAAAGGAVVGGSSSRGQASSIGWRWRKALWRKCSGLVRPLWRWPRKSVRVDDLDRKVCEVRRWGNSSVQASPGTGRGGSEFSPRVSPARASGYSWCGDESSIHEAILYCKRSIEK